MKFYKPTDEQILRVLATMPRTTTQLIADAIEEDLNTFTSVGTILKRLNALHDEGLVSRRVARTSGGRYYTWWINKEISK